MLYHLFIIFFVVLEVGIIRSFFSAIRCVSFIQFDMFSLYSKRTVVFILVLTGIFYRVTHVYLCHLIYLVPGNKDLDRLAFKLLTSHWQATVRKICLAASDVHYRSQNKRGNLHQRTSTKFPWVLNSIEIDGSGLCIINRSSLPTVLAASVVLLCGSRGEVRHLLPWIPWISCVDGRHLAETVESVVYISGPGRRIDQPTN